MHEKIETIINEWDPVDLFPLAPKDEYSQEIKKVSHLLKKNPHVTVDELANELKLVFVESFGEDMIFRNNELEIAQKLLNLYSEE